MNHRIAVGKSVQIGDRLYKRGEETEFEVALKTLKAAERKALLELCLKTSTIFAEGEVDPLADDATIDRELTSTDGAGDLDDDDVAEV